MSFTKPDGETCPAFLLGCDSAGKRWRAGGGSDGVGVRPRFRPFHWPFTSLEAVLGCAINIHSCVMPPMLHPPIVLLPICLRHFEDRWFHALPEAYSEAVRVAGCLPMLVTAEGPEEIDVLLDLADGILLPGSPNNVHPSHFNEVILNHDLPLDLKRDGLSLPLIRAAIARGIPLLGICRGHQELNVALGGSLHQALHEVSGYANHQPHVDDVLERRYGPAHDIEIQPGGLLESILGKGSRRVNSIHGQGIHRIAPGMIVEALAPDGVIEAISNPAACGFNLGVQWHPEWQAVDNPVSEAIFGAFGEACRVFQAQRRQVPRQT